MLSAAEQICAVEDTFAKAVDDVLGSATLGESADATLVIGQI